MTEQTFLNTPEDMRWLREVHWPELPPEYLSAVLSGNEDWPEKISAYLSTDPRFDDIPLVFFPKGA